MSNAYFKIEDSKNGQFFWSLVAPNHETLCHSETYTTKQAAEKGVEACKKYATNAEVKDLTESADNTSNKTSAGGF